MRIRLWILLFLSAGLCGCKGSPPLKKVARVNLYSDPGTLDPRQVKDLIGQNVALLLYEGLTRIGPDNTPTLALAQSVVVSPDGLRVTITLRSSLWSNGEALIADDFVQTWQAALAPDFPSTYAYQLYVLKHAEAIKAKGAPPDILGARATDDHTLVLDLEHPVPHLLDLLATPPFFPYHQEGCSNGPFLKDEWRPDQHLILKRNPYFWDAHSISLEGMDFPIIESEYTSLLMFERGELDYIGLPFFMIPLEAVHALEANKVLCKQEVAAIYWYLLNTQHPLLTNPNIRKALSLSLHRRSLAHYVSQGVHTPAQGALPDCLRQQYQPEQPSLHDPRMARRLFAQGLKELGLTLAEVPPLELSFNHCADHLKIAATIQQQWQQTLGLETVLKVCGWQEHLSHLAEGNFTIARHAWLANVADPFDFLEPFATSGVRNPTLWNNAHFYKLVCQARQEQQSELRKELLDKAETLLLEEAPIIPLLSLRYPYCTSPSVQRIVITPRGTVDFRWAKFAPASSS